MDEETRAVRWDLAKAAALEALTVLKEILPEADMVISVREEATGHPASTTPQLCMGTVPSAQVPGFLQRVIDRHKGVPERTTILDVDTEKRTVDVLYKGKPPTKA